MARQPLLSGMVSPLRLVCSALVFAWRVASLVRVDDSEVFSDLNRHGIQYSSGWIRWHSPDPMNPQYWGTYTWTRIAGSRLMFSFVGTGISYYADRTPGSGVVLVAIDGDQYPAVHNETTRVEYRQLLFAVSGLAPGDHQIVIGTPANESQTGVVGLDFFGVNLVKDDVGYVPFSVGPGIRGLPADVTLVDDSDSAIHYSDSSWQIYDIDSSGPAPLFYNGTQHSSNVTGSSISFSFRGTGIWYFSDDSRGNANVLISIDEQKGDIVSTTTGVTSISQRMFWSRTDLKDGEHTVTITHVGKRGQFASLDFFAYSPSASTSGSSSTHRFVSISITLGSLAGGFLVIALLSAGFIFIYKHYIAESAGRTLKEGNTVATSVHHVTLTKTNTQDSEITLVGSDKAVI